MLYVLGSVELHLLVNDRLTFTATWSKAPRLADLPAWGPTPFRYNGPLCALGYPARPVI